MLVFVLNNYYFDACPLSWVSRKLRLILQNLLNSFHKVLIDLIEDIQHLELFQQLLLAAHSEDDGAGVRLREDESERKLDDSRVKLLRGKLCQFADFGDLGLPLGRL